MKYIIFDYDGTLHNSIRIYEPAFKRTYDYLVNNGYAEEKVFKEDEVSRFLGLTARQMWNDFMPSLPEDEKKKCSSIIGEAMIQYIDEGQAELYDGTIETLVKLNELGYKLIFLSNCKVSYMKKHIEIFRLDKYFIDFIVARILTLTLNMKFLRLLKKSIKGILLLLVIGLLILK